MKKYGLRLFGILLVVVVLWHVSRSRTFQLFGTLYARVNTAQKVVALTFDDGPTSQTDSILAILRDLDSKATFFVTGKELAMHSLEGQKIVLAGHQLGNHTYSHSRMVLKTWDYTRREIEKTDSLIRLAGYRGEILFRPPNGKKLFVLPYYLQQTNRKTIMWDVEPESYANIANDSKKITQNVLENTKPGSIILLHVMYDRPESVKAIRQIVNGLKQQGYTFKTVSELLRYH
ncbi:polysaccharide deacetylase family protein [Spirosoma sp. SC4-14]|uniref:polysaccharide deacetylase family protein n=1 Tax=Spirosoma sp. SC4-14 TaxID=3128900 RepID=UPI0030D2FD95